MELEAKHSVVNISFGGPVSIDNHMYKIQQNFSQHTLRRRLAEIIGLDRKIILK
jgi:hypothetical protein